MRLRIPDGVIFEEVDHEVVLLSLDGGRYYKLNRSGSRVWALIREHGDLARVQDAMVQETDADAARVREDIASLVADLGAGGLIEIEEP